MVTYPPRYEGKRWSLVFGAYEGVEQFAINEMQRSVQRFLPYVIAVHDGTNVDPQILEHVILVGTVDNHPLIRGLVEAGHLTIPSEAQGFTAACFASPWGEENKVLVAAGADAAGVSYAVQEIAAQWMDGHILVENHLSLRESFDRIPPFRISDAPRVHNRGIWTWGYVVYDYRRFLDNMARLRMNMITIWNDCPPLNAREVIEYAHARGIQVVLGFHWGWGQSFDPNSREALESLTSDVREKYVQQYRDLGIDGIYFQTFTETYETEYGGRSIASLACEWVNHIAGALFDLDPDLSIQFGLHAMSVADDVQAFQSLDPRITITWEDAGAIPYSYEPVADLRPLGETKPESLLTPEGKMAFSRSLVGLNGNGGFAMVPKGYTKLRWETEFEHHGPFVLGERDADWIRRRAANRRERWDHANALWIANNPLAAEFYREILDLKPETVTLTALVEDGLLEEHIELSVALFAETAWNPYREDTEILRRALSPFYRH